MSSETTKGTEGTVASSATAPETKREEAGGTDLEAELAKLRAKAAELEAKVEASKPKPPTPEELEAERLRQERIEAADRRVREDTYSSKHKVRLGDVVLFRVREGEPGYREHAPAIVAGIREDGLDLRVLLNSGDTPHFADVKWGTLAGQWYPRPR